ncbi:MAG: nlhH [Akkermansiaceae bacterium]|nr:nlhH [Akkermansiaceae bacterium]
MKTNFTTTRRMLLGLGCIALCASSPAFALDPAGSTAAGIPKAVTKTPQETPPKADPQMQAVLDALASLDPKPFPSLSAEDARKQPGPTDAVKKLMKDQDKQPEKVDTVDDITIKLSDRKLDARIYRPAGDGPFPVIMYIHGGGWVVANLDTYDSAPRALANAAHALVVSVHYHQGPEFRFPAAHEDVFGAYQWLIENAGQYKGDSKTIAVVGESAGGNLAANVSIMAQAKGIQMPVHQVLVYPVANYAFDTPSYLENANAKPLSAAMMPWFFDNYLTKPEDGKDPKISLLQAKSLKGLPPTTVITAQIDPLRSEGEALANKLKADGVTVSYRNYDGVTHEFFGMGAVVDKARQAVDFAAGNLKTSFEGKTLDTAKSE